MRAMNAPPAAPRANAFPLLVARGGDGGGGARLGSLVPLGG